MKLHLTALFSICFSLLHAQDFSHLYKKVSPAVVAIVTEEKEIVKIGNVQGTSTSQGLGSGFLIDEEGTIMTAAHVISSAENIKVIMQNGEKIPAKAISSSFGADVALIKTTWKPENPVVAKLADSEQVNIGDQVMVIGHPFGLNYSMSVGYISGKHAKKIINGSFTAMEFFQTDAAINHGNSGGPMFNTNGEVIGVVSYILSESGGFDGLGFAATSNIAKKILLEDKMMWSGFDGVVISKPTTEILNVPQKEAILVQKVAAMSPAGMMGLRGSLYNIVVEGQKLKVGGDIILAVAGIKFNGEASYLEIREALLNLSPGDKLEFTVLRNGKTMDLDYTIPVP